MIVAAEGLTLQAGATTILDGVSFEIAPGEFVAVVGESGSGKTMLARALIGLLPRGVRQTGGTVLFGGVDLARSTPAQWRERRGPGMGMVFQEPMTSLNPAMTVGAQLAEGLRLHERLTAGELRSRCTAMMARVGLRDPGAAWRSYPHEYSGGMRQRIMLASVMLLRPRLLIADEPTTALDALSQRAVLDLMTELARDEGTAVLLVTHDLGIVARYAKRAIVLHRGRLIEQGTVDALLQRPADPYTRALVEAARPTIAIRPARPATMPVIVARHITVRYGGRRRWLRRAPGLLAVRGVDVTVGQGEVVAVVGGSGSGKTTLGRALLGLQPTESGDITVAGVTLSSAEPAQRRAARLSCQLVFQDPYSSLDPRMTVAQIVDEPLRHLPGLDRAARRDRVVQGLEEVGLSAFASRHPHALSGGQRQRVAIARAIVRRPAFVVADEPVSALDMTIRAQVLALLRDLQTQYGFACLFISHDLTAVAQIADRILVMQDGAVVEQGVPDIILRSPAHAYTRLLLAAG